jgi:DNA-binding GntR family transcriptional regulator
MKPVGSKKGNSLQERVYNNLKSAIIRGEVESNTRLVEEELAARMQTSRTPVREAFQKLEKEGFLERRPKVGYEVKGLYENDAEELFEVRTVLDCYAGFLAAQRATAEEIKVMEEIVRKERDSLQNMDVDEFISSDNQFHDCIYLASKDQRLYRLFTDIRDHMHRYRAFILRFKRKPERAIRTHEQIVEAISAGNGKKVERLMRNHSRRTKGIVKKYIRMAK